MSDTGDEMLRRCFAQRPLPAADPALVREVSAAVARRRRLLVQGSAGLALVAALLGPKVTQLALLAAETAQGLAGAVMGADVSVTGLIVLLAVGFAAWVLVRSVRCAGWR